MPQKQAHPLNCEGDFYVEHNGCTTCDLPRTLASDMFRYTAKEDHCYVYQQPQTEEQINRMITVMEQADLACVRCRSRDPKLLQLLRNKGLKKQCDFRPKQSKWPDFWFTIAVRIFSGIILGAGAGIFFGFDWRGWRGILTHLAEGNFRWVILWLAAWAAGGIVISLCTIPYWQRPWYKGLNDSDDDKNA